MASIEEANLLFKNLVTYEKSVAMAKKYVKYHKAVVEDLKRLETLEEENQDLKNRLANEQLAFDKLFESNQKLSELYAKLKKTIDILKDKLGLYLVEETFGKETIYALMSKVLGICISNHTKEEYELLKEVLGNE